MFPCHRARKSCESDSARKRDTEHGKWRTGVRAVEECGQSRDVLH